MTAAATTQMTLSIGDGAMPSETFTAISGIKLTQMRLQQEAVQLSEVRATPWQKRLDAGGAFLEMIGEGVFTDSASERTLQAAAFAKTKCNMKLLLASGDEVAGAFLITHYERGGELGAIEQFKVVLTSASQVTLN